MIGGLPLTSFADKVAEATGLAGMLAKGAVGRCCARAGINAARMRPRDLERILPNLESILHMYLSVMETAQGVDRLQRLAEGLEHTEPFGRARCNPAATRAPRSAPKP